VGTNQVELHFVVVHLMTQIYAFRQYPLGIIAAMPAQIGHCIKRLKWKWHSRTIRKPKPSIYDVNVNRMLNKKLRSMAGMHQ